jgi:PD-(D/E)XK nuclease superfamily
MQSSLSQFKMFGACQRKWVLGRKYEPKAKAAALAEGDVFHTVLGKFYGQNTEAAGLEVYEVTMAEYLENAKAAGLHQDKIDRLAEKFAVMKPILTSYWKHVSAGDQLKYGFIAIERPFEIKLARGLVIKGYIDGIWRDLSTGARFIVEHKYQSGFDEELMALDLQVSLYTMALLPEFGLLPTLYNVGVKPLNRRGKNETIQAFQERVADGIDKEMSGFQYRSGEFTSKYFIRRTFSRGRRDLEVAYEQMVNMAKLMARVKKNEALAYRNVGDQCLYMCPFREICIEEDPLVIENLFIEKHKPEKKVVRKV